MYTLTIVSPCDKETHNFAALFPSPFSTTTQLDLSLESSVPFLGSTRVGDHCLKQIYFSTSTATLESCSKSGSPCIFWHPVPFHCLILLQSIPDSSISIPCLSFDFDSTVHTYFSFLSQENVLLLPCQLLVPFRLIPLFLHSCPKLV